MGIRIIADSASDLLKSDAQQLNVQVVPLKVIFGSEEYRDGVDITMEEFYSKLSKADSLPSTSQPTPNDYIVLFEEAKAAGDEVIVITLSSQLSGTFQSATLAKNYVEYDNIYLIDSYNVTVGVRLLIDIACQRRDEGVACVDIVNEIEQLKPRIRLKAMMNTLDYLVKGGRLSKVAGFAGSLLSIKPIIEIKDGKVALVAKGRGKKAAMEALYKEIENDTEIDSTMPIAVAYTQDEDGAVALKDFLATKGINAGNIYPIGSTIGTHAGPGASAIIYFCK